jgi:hypothetical protein
MVGKAAKPKRKLGSSRLNPMAAPGAAAEDVPTAAEEKQLEAEAEEQSGRILSDLRHFSPEVRARAAHLVASMASTGIVGVKVMLRSGIISLLTGMLCDGAAEVRDGAVSALRNCGIRGGDAVWTAMVKADVMTTLLAALLQQPVIRGGLEAAPAERAGWEPHPDVLGETCQLLDLLWSIGESSEDAVARFNAAGMVLLAPLISLAATGGGPAAAAAATAAAAARKETPAQAASSAAAAQVCGRWGGCGGAAPARRRRLSSRLAGPVVPHSACELLRPPCCNTRGVCRCGWRW